MTIGNRDVDVYQIYTQTQQPLRKPRLLPVLVGVLKEQLIKENIGTYSGSQLNLEYSSKLRNGSILDEESLKVFLRTKANGDILLSKNDYEVTSQGILLNEDITINFSILNDKGGNAKVYYDGSDYYLEDQEANFFVSGVYGDDSIGDEITLLQLYGETYNVKEVVGKTLLKLSVENTTSLYSAFLAKPNRIFEGIIYDIDRTLTIGSPLLSESQVLISCLAVRIDKEGELNKLEDFEDTLNDLVPFIDSNPIGYGINLLSQFAYKEIAYVTTRDESVSEFNRALDLIDDDDCYYLVPLTMDKDVVEMFTSHVVAYSQPTARKERRVYASITIPDKVVKVKDQVCSIENISGKYYLEDSIGQFIDKGVNPGDIISLDYEDTSNEIKLLHDYKVKAVLANDKIEILKKVVNRLSSGSNGYTNKTSGSFFTDTTFPASIVSGTKLRILDGDNPGEYEVDTVTTGTPNELTLVGVTAGYFTNNTALSWEIVEDSPSITGGIDYNIETETLDMEEKADYINGLGKSFSEKRTSIIFPDKMISEENYIDETGTIISEIKTVHGYFAAVAMVGLRFATAPQKPCTGEILPGFVGVSYDHKYKDSHLLKMQQGGIIVLHPESVSKRPVIRQQLTTDVSDILKQEISVVETVDMFTKYLRENIRFMLGKRNITKQTLNVLRMRVDALIEACKNDRNGVEPMIGANTKMLSLAQDEECKDRVKIRIDYDALIPMNGAIIEIYI